MTSRAPFSDRGGRRRRRWWLHQSEVLSLVFAFFFLFFFSAVGLLMHVLYHVTIIAQNTGILLQAIDRRKLITLAKFAILA